MGIFSRLGTLIKSNLNDLISKAEDPEKMLNQVLVEMKTQLVEAKKQVALAIGDEKRLKKQWDDQKRNAEEWERRAVLAVQAGDDELAKEALLRQREHEDLAGQFQQQWTTQKEAVDKLKEQLRILNDRIEEAKRKRNLLLAKQKRAEAQKAIQATMAGLSDTSAFEAFERIAEKIERVEAEAESAEVMANLEGDSLTQRFKVLEGQRGPADMALLELKAKMGLLPGGSGGTEPQKALSGDAATTSSSSPTMVVDIPAKSSSAPNKTSE